MIFVTPTRITLHRAAYGSGRSPQVLGAGFGFDECAGAGTRSSGIKDLDPDLWRDGVSGPPETGRSAFRCAVPFGTR
ncbi:hypothetical protein [Rhodococcus tibetensis]|uniref:Uncharacterized protein n=1 Tax=Rhodococcus tibetensis TaxID=2965064 RepID=A0ABT1QF37_9NOCA|nr:hypothetical protein [Rhodococcus sp. FXJ9.536]MCQ4120891.1 hypothetical protein [Rhodococcus sp. FXJ9.536]